MRQYAEEIINIKHCIIILTSSLSSCTKEISTLCGRLPLSSISLTAFSLPSRSRGGSSTTFLTALAAGEPRPNPNGFLVVARFAAGFALLVAALALALRRFGSMRTSKLTGAGLTL